MNAPLLSLLNGAEVAGGTGVSVTDRGLNYGDGLFETAVLRGGVVRFLDAHLERLQLGCERLGIGYPREGLSEDIRRACMSGCDGVLKIVITRGAAGRGYRPDVTAAVSRFLTVHPMPASAAQTGLTIRWCETRLSRNTALAGIKHLNRLEQVLAQREWNDDAVAEGLMLDTEGELVSATASNVFAVRQGTLMTPDLRFCGVRGVMRGQVLRMATGLGLQISEEPLWPHDLDDVTEVFLTNAVRGIRPVVQLAEQQWPAGPVAAQFTAALAL